ncbi:Extradiol ring-cleavage dioxygenase, class III enzyme, subunit B [Dactylonectria macrodidyma]|uniref:Extradiol ring-cleavage dioxygenase, class III enzyme, subunit B n=1 Tax=Dactylonectria macrodidyma TaxID=307937 RepID=A0A9P9JH39_9HYPO|nr:Extradiol ring-cleavage dioxygenase, class III enzyme, subunit B [Dactylonectria macrodidyma]
MSQALSFRALIGLSLAVAMFAFLGASPLKAFTSTLQRAGIDWFSTQQSTSAAASSASSPAKMAITPRTPVYFFSHGGPDVQYQTKHPVYPILQQIGKEITQQVKPKAVVVFSAHWMGEEGAIHVNKEVQMDLIYDFYGFPDHFYKAKYPNKGDPELASKIMVMLSEAGIQSHGVKRGLDHGVWSGFHVAFNPETNPLNVPLVQVSLYKNEDPHAHYALGRAVAALREQGIVIIGAGMSVHNLRDMHYMYEGNNEPMPYTVSFDNALKEAVEVDPALREEKMAAVTKRGDAHQAHPFMDHLMPVYIAAGAAGEDWGKQTWTLHEGSFGWAQYRFGSVPASPKL